jgi:hypothetical protein
VKRANFSDRVVTLAGGAALVTVPVAADASVVVVDSRPIVVPLFGPIGETIGWDIDGNGSIEFEIFRTGYPSSSNFGTGVAKYEKRAVFMASVTESGTPLNGRGLVAPPASLTSDPLGEDDAQVLFPSFTVGPTLANNYQWGRTAERFRILGYGAQTTVSYTTGNAFKTSYAAIGYDFHDYGFQPGPNFFGFRFEGDAGLQYGWGVLNYGGGADGPAIRINYWQYGSAADEGVHIAEPASVLPLVALLGLGAAGVRRWRRTRSEAGNA